MTPFEIGLLALAAMVLLVLLGLYVPIALMLCSFVGVWAIRGSPELAGNMLALAANDTIASYFFGVVPLFVLMGFVVSEAGIGRDAYDVANALFRRIRGGLGIGTVGANAIFAAVTGISIASAAVFTRIAVPEMLRHGYTQRFALGIVAGSSVLGMLIPPSLLLILYGLLTEQSIGDLFAAGIVPGLLLAVFFALGVIVLALLAPRFTGTAAGVVEEEPAGALLLKAMPITLLIVLVLGGLYGGIFTPVEAGAVGAIAAIVVGVLKLALVRAGVPGLSGGLTWGGFRRVLVETGLVTASISFLIIAAQMYSRMLAFSGVPAGFAEGITTAEIGFWGTVLIYVLVVIALGMILDSSSIMLILVPLMLPVVTGMGVDLIWFGIVTVIAVEIGLLTPPFGISVYVIKSTLDDPSVTLGQIFLGAAPFAAIMAIVLALVMVFPGLATFLPEVL
ncbi:MAG: TRAP transporter large permease subunit [Pseudomonadota bacterium]